MLSLSINQSWLRKMMCMLALMIGTSIFVPAAQAFQEEEPAVEVAEEAASEDVEVPAAEAAESTEEMEADAASEEADELPYYTKGEADYVTNTLFMMICAVLVILMQPGFALLEVGLNAKKNTVNILFKNVMDLSVGVLLYYFIGWGIMYPGDFNGYFAYAGPGVAADAADLDYGFSNSVDFLFQVAF
ncbi:MAG: ammonium transporter, partial [Pirellulaceae bacterium]